MEAIIGPGLAIIGIVVVAVLIYFFVSGEKRNYPNNTSRENIDFATKMFDSNRSSTLKIQDFDTFKYSGFDVKSPIYTYTTGSKSSNPYSKVSVPVVDPSLSLNSTILSGDVAVDTVGASMAVTKVASEELIPTLSGLNANTEASIRGSMVSSELRRMRR